jgi:hypothetical protein
VKPNDAEILWDSEEASTVAARCWQLLGERPPRIIGIALADLHGRFLATLPGNERKEAVEHHAALADFIARARTMVHR